MVVFLAVAGLTAGVIKINTATAATCPCHVFDFNPTPGSFNEATGIEVGFKFKSDLPGYISGIRFYKNVAMTGTHTASLWTNMGVRVAQVPFTAETASGWQEVNFTPVPIAANTIYTASVYMANGYYAATSNYFTSDIFSDPLVVPRDNTAQDGFGFGKQGVYKVGATSAYPNDSFNAGNYWVDVTYTGSLNSDPPVVTETDPSTNESSVLLGSSVTATFDQILDSSTVTSSTFFVQDNNGTTIPGTLSYSGLTKRATFTSDAPFQVGATYTATLKGGSGTVIKSLDGIALAQDHAWSFTTVTTDPCPCSLKDKSGVEGSVTSYEGIGVELGIKLAPQANGYLSKIRFYKPITSTDSTHIGNIWDNLGNKLATVTFTNETEYGWQEATLTTPLHVTQGNIYIVSYGTPSGVYQSTGSALGSAMGNDSIRAYATGDTRNAATSSGNTNGVYASTANAYPNAGNPTGTYYWVDAVFTTDDTPSDPLEVENTQPKSDAYGVQTDQQKLITLSKTLNPASVTSTNVKVVNGSGVPVVITPTYDDDKHQIVLLPSGGQWNPDEAYTVTITTGLAAADGSTLTSEYSTKFTTGSAEVTDVDNGLGGPLLVITSGANAYDTYYAEILRTEGITYFDIKDVASVDASVLSGYRAAILAEMPLSQPQADMLTTWVNDGGNLVAMRPDKKLAGLLGLQDASSVRTNQYLKVDTNLAPGSGIVGDSMQFKGDADNYTNLTSRVVAPLYSDASTSTSNPGVTVRSVGSKGGEAMAFTYDLAKSVIMMHQGNQAWAGTDRDGDAVRRGNDLFYGNKTGDVQPDWVDMNKIHIPQADEQQRLLVNMLSESVKDSLPMPRFWYLPHDNKAAVVFAGDDHEIGVASGTTVHLNEWLNESAKDCSLLDWECVRASHYMYPGTPISNDRAVQYQSLGFEVADHPSNSGGCNNFSSYAQVNSTLAASLIEFRTIFPGLPNQTTSRFHCYLWSDWDSIARAEIANGIRYSLEYVAYPPSWINSKSPLMTGSGMNMRLTDSSGALLDIYQGVTNFDNTAADITSINTLLDNAIGSTGYYGMYGTHYDMSDNYDRLVFNAARSRNIPLITAKQSLEWLDGRGSSQFASLTSPSKGKVTFTIRAGQGATGLRAMMPISDGAGTLSTIESLSSNATYTTKTIKGVDYAVFDAMPGEYVVTYSDYSPTTPPVPEPDSGGNGSSTSPGTAGNSAQSSDRRLGMTALEKEGDYTSPQDASTPNKPGDEQISDSGKDDPEKPTDTTEQGVVWWWLWILGILALLGFIWFVIAKRRRKAHDPS